MDPKNQRGAIGPIVGLVVILGIILAGGIYFYTTMKSNTGYDQNVGTQTRENSGTSLDLSAQFSAQSTSTEPGDIEQDLNSVDANSINSVGTDL